MKKNSLLLLILALLGSFLILTNGFGQDDNSILMKKDYCETDLEEFLNDVAVVFGVHSQLTKYEKIHIPELDLLVEDTKKYLEQQGISFLELAGRDDFLKLTGRARICAHVLYQDLERIFGVELPKVELLNVSFCEEIKIAKSIKNIMNFIY